MSREHKRTWFLSLCRHFWHLCVSDSPLLLPSASPSEPTPRPSPESPHHHSESLGQHQRDWRQNSFPLGCLWLWQGRPQSCGMLHCTSGIAMISPQVHISAETASTAVLTDEGPVANCVLVMRNIHLQFARLHHTGNEKCCKFSRSRGLNMLLYCLYGVFKCFF